MIIKNIPVNHFNQPSSKSVSIFVFVSGNNSHHRMAVVLDIEAKAAGVVAAAAAAAGDEDYVHLNDLFSRKARTPSPKSSLAKQSATA